MRPIYLYMEKHFLSPILALFALIAVIAFQNCGKGFQVNLANTEIGLSSTAATLTLSDNTTGSTSYSKGQTVNLSSRGDETATAWCPTENSSFDPSKNCPSGAPGDGWLKTRPATFQLSTGDGPKTVYVWIKDSTGKATKGSAIITLDSTSPIVTVTTPPPSFSNSRSLSVIFTTSESGSGLDSTQCQLDMSTATPCTSPAALNGLTEGAHSLKILSRDRAGNTSESLISWQNDFTPPTVTVTSGPSNPTNATSATFFLNSLDGISGLQSVLCKIDNNAFSTCSNPANFTGLSAGTQGTHTFSVQATDLAGNVSSVTTYSWQIVLTVPTATITSSPSNPTNASAANFIFLGNGSTSLSFTCSLDGNAAVACQGSKFYSNLSSGAHTFTLSVTDLVGGSSTQTYQWVVDLTAPVVTLINPPSNTTNQTSYSIAFNATDSGSSIAASECKLNSANFSSCSSPFTFTLSDGTHTLSVRATDAVGKVSQASTVQWTIDTVAPTVTITSGPTSPTTNTSATFTFTSSEAGRFECALDNSSFSGCSSGKNYSNLSLSSHVFSVRAFDAVENASTIATSTWVIESPVDPTEPTGRTIAPFGYGRVEQIMPGNSSPGQTGQWWCDRHLGVNAGGKWKCLSVSGLGSCSQTAPSNELITCQFGETQSISSSLQVPGQTGAWWCRHHFEINVGGSWSCVSVNGDPARCNQDVSTGETTVCGRNLPAVDEAAFAPDISCQKTATIANKDFANLFMLNDWCTMTPYQNNRLRDTIYQYNDYIRVGVNRFHGGTLFEIYGTDKVNRIQEHGGSAMQLSIWGYDRNSAGAGFFRTVACDPNFFPFTNEGRQACQAANQNNPCAARILGSHIMNCTTEVKCAWSAGDPWNPIQAQGANCGWGGESEVTSVAGNMNVGVNFVEVAKVAPYNFTRPTAFNGMTWSQKTELALNEPYVKTHYKMIYNNPSRPLGFHGQEVPALFLGDSSSSDGRFTKFFYYKGPRPYQNSSSVVTVVNSRTDPASLKALRLPNRSVDDCLDPTQTIVVPCDDTFITEDWATVCDDAEVRCITIASFSPITRFIVTTTTNYFAFGSRFELNANTTWDWDIYVFPYKYNDIVAGKTIRQRIFELRP